MTSRTISVELAGESVQLSPFGTLFWPRERTLFVADLHLGKAATFRNLGRIAVPRGTTASTLARLENAVEEVGARTVVILGDLWHARSGCDSEVLGAFSEWRRRRGHCRIALVEGNHDRHARADLTGLDVEEWGREATLGPFRVQHEPPSDDSHFDDNGYFLAGHLHPAARLIGSRESLVLPCFWLGNSLGVLPAFGDFTGRAVIAPFPEDRVFVIAEGTVISVGRNPH